MSIQHLNTVRQIDRLATRLGATLPTEITAALDHLEQLIQNSRTAPQPGTVAASLTQHLGNPAAMDKARKTAAAALTTAEALAKIDAYLVDACGSRLRMLMRQDGEEVADAFGEALAPAIATLDADASSLPTFFRAEQADSLDPGTFAAWTRVRDAYAHILSAQLALDVLYLGAIADDIHFPIVAAGSLRFAEPPAFSNAREACGFRDALAGRAEKGMGLAAQGPVMTDGLFIPTLLAHCGARFAWATPSEVTARAASVVSATAELVPA